MWYLPYRVEEDGETQPGHGEVGVPCLALYHGESGCSAFTRGAQPPRWPGEEEKVQRSLAPLPDLPPVSRGQCQWLPHIRTPMPESAVKVCW